MFFIYLFFNLKKYIIKLLAWGCAYIKWLLCIGRGFVTHSRYFFKNSFRFYYDWNFVFDFKTRISIYTVSLSVGLYIIVIYLAINKKLRY